MLKGPEQEDLSALEIGQEPLVLVCGSDDNYSMALAVALHSIMVHLEPGSFIYIIIIDGGISESNKLRLREIVNIDHITVQLELVKPDMTHLNDLKVSGHVTRATYFSLLVPDIVPNRYDKAIYLDCDIQVQANLEQLWQEEMNSHALLAVQDFLIPYISSPGGLSKYTEMGFKPDMPYFNAGVLVFNLKRWRKEKISRKVIHYLHQYREHLNFRDQEGLNAVLVSDWRKLNPKWNVASSILTFERWTESPFKAEIGVIRDDLLQNPYIFHFTGASKPWHLRCEHPAKVQWRRYLYESGWFNPLAKKEPKMNKAAGYQATQLAYARPKTKVTVIVPTYNRARFLKDCLSSVLGQDYEDFQIIILDDASSDEMEEVVQSLADSRLTYVRNQLNLGLFNNWNRAFEFNTSPYLCLLPDDDTLLPGFIRESVQALNEYPQAAMCTSLARYIDVNGQPIGRQDIEGMPRGVISGLDYLHSLVAGLTWTIHPATVLLRSSALSTVGSFEAPHAKQLLDMNLYIRLATHYKIVFINKELAQVRRHSGQTRAQQFQAIEGTETLATIAERIDSVGYLLQSTRAKDASYRNWLAERLHLLNKERGHLSRLLIPSLHLTWAEQKKLEAKLIADVIPPRETLILIDDDMWISESILGRRALPFPERNGQYWGAPTDDNTAIREVERLRRCGASFLVFGSTTFWWFDHYEKFCGYLNSKYNCILGNDHLRVYDIRSMS